MYCDHWSGLPNHLYTDFGVPLEHLSFKRKGNMVSLCRHLFHVNNRIAMQSNLFIIS